MHSFDAARAQESKDGFIEKPAQAESFFRAGTSGQWRDALAPDIVERIVEAHRPMMKKFRYLPA